MIGRSVLAAFLLTAAPPAFAAEYFVSPAGAAGGDGSRDRPFATLPEATAAARAGDTVWLREGVYRETLRPERSGEEGAPIVFANWNGERAVLTGADPLTDWRAEENGVYSASMPWTLGTDNQCFADGVMLSEACWPAPGPEPLFNPNRGVASGGSESTLVCPDLPGGDDAWKGARLWCAGGTAWICWTKEVTHYDAASHTLTFKDPDKNKWRTPRKGNLFVLKGLRASLTAPGQWYYDEEAKRLFIVPPEGADMQALKVEAKRRTDAIDLSGRSHIHVRGLEFAAAGIRTDGDSTDIVLEKLQGRYVAHSNVNDISGKSGVLLHGRSMLLVSCDLGYSSGSVVSVRGQDNRVVNNHIHHGGYMGLWRGTVSLAGRRTVFSHNTVRHAGRDLITTHGLMQSLVQYNDVSDAGWLTKDLAMFYGHNTDFAGTEFKYNWVHDNHAEHCAMGIYFDHLSHNMIVHHNVVWNVDMDPTRVNNPSYNALIFNNTCVNTGLVSTFDHSKRNDLFASRYFNNVYNRPPKLPDHVALYGNQIVEKPLFRDPDHDDYRLNPPAYPDAGAYAPDGVLWRAGCDLENPPDPLPVYEAPRIDWMNTVHNACFEFGSLEDWETTDVQQGTLTKGNGWGNTAVGSDKDHATGTSKYELRLGPDRDGVKQTITGLSPDVTYTLSAWGRVSDDAPPLTLGVRGHGGEEQRADFTSTQWERRSITFTTGPDATQAEVFFVKPEGGHAWCDNVTLPLSPG